jgi:hypothetical protein
MVHVCPRCYQQCKSKFDMKRHFDRKIVCKIKINDISIKQCNNLLLNGETKIEKIKIVHICECGKQFNRKSRLNRHKEVCQNVIVELKIENEMLIENKKKEIEILRHQNQIELEKLRHQNEKDLIKPVPFHKETKQNFIYLLQEREFIKTGECVYKIGKTINPKARLTDYSKGTMVCCLLLCENCDELEKRLIAIFTEKFKLRCDIGKEYFEGDVYEMVKTIKLN